MIPDLRNRLTTILERALSPRILWPGLLAVSLLLSVAAWFLRPLPTRSAVLFFPRAGDFRLEGEPRQVLPGGTGLEDGAREVVEEFLLGPGDSRRVAALPRGTRLREILYRRGRLYVDFSEDAVLAREPPLDLGLRAVRKTLRYNFPTLGSILITVNGREPGVTGTAAAGDPKKK
ncbi:MAG: GerMN domain-containing protein [Treponema sp.]|nr:GerMN domain-containing protein [Treponema sp.]